MSKKRTHIITKLHDFSHVCVFSPVGSIDRKGTSPGSTTPSLYSPPSPDTSEIQSLGRTRSESNKTSTKSDYLKGERVKKVNSHCNSSSKGVGLGLSSKPISFRTKVRGRKGGKRKARQKRESKGKEQGGTWEKTKALEKETPNTLASNFQQCDPSSIEKKKQGDLQEVSNSKVYVLATKDTTPKAVSCKSKGKRKHAPASPTETRMKGKGKSKPAEEGPEKSSNSKSQAPNLAPDEEEDSLPLVVMPTNTILQEQTEAHPQHRY